MLAALCRGLGVISNAIIICFQWVYVWIKTFSSANKELTEWALLFCTVIYKHTSTQEFTELCYSNEAMSDVAEVCVSLQLIGYFSFWVNVTLCTPRLHLFNQNTVNIVKCYYHLKKNVLYFNIFWNVIYSCDAKLNFQHHYSTVFSVTWSLRNHHNVLICCSRNIYFCYQS